MCVGCVHRHGVVKLVALVVRERRVVRRSGPLGSRPLVLCVRVHGLRHRRGLGVGLVFSAGLLLSRGLAVVSWVGDSTGLPYESTGNSCCKTLNRTETGCNMAFFVLKPASGHPSHIGN